MPQTEPRHQPHSGWSTKRTHRTRGSTRNQRTQRTKRTRSNQMNRDAPGQHARGTHAAAQNERTVRQMRAHAKQHGERADTHRTPRGAESAMHSQLEHTGGSGRKGLSCGGCARPRVRARARTHRPSKHVRLPPNAKTTEHSGPTPTSGHPPGTPPAAITTDPHDANNTLPTGSASTTTTEPQRPRVSLRRDAIPTVATCARLVETRN